MPMNIRHASLLLLTLGSLSAQPAKLDSPDNFHAWIRKSYAFSPHELNSAQIDEKSKLLDEIWKEIGDRKATLLPRLHEELTRSDQPRFFYYDGSKLLLSLEKTPAAKALAASAIARCDIHDVLRDDYFYLVRSLGMERCDIVGAALNILDDEQFRVFVPAHALTLEADYCLIYMLNYVDPKLSVPKLIARFEADPRESARIAAITALWYTLEPTALAYIDTIPRVEDMPEKLRGRVFEFRKRNALRNKALIAFTSESSLRAKRKESLRRVSDEALIEYEDFTRDIVGKMKP